MKYLFGSAFIFLSLLTSISPASAQTPPTSTGICHQVGQLGNPFVTWGYVSGEAVWRTIEPQRKVFNWTTIDQAVEAARGAGKKVWLQVLTDDGGVNIIPDWAINSGMGVLPDPIPASTATYCSFKPPGSRPACANYSKKNRPTQWDPRYLEFLQEILTAMAQRYDNNDTVEAILMMSGGHYGEMALQVKYYRWDTNPDALNPHNAYINEMARVKGETPESIASPYPGYISKFDYYFVENSKRLVDMYARTFRNKAIVIQAGSGLSGDGEGVAGRVVDYAVNTYGKRVWLKQNGLGNWGGSDWYNTLFGRYKTKTRVTREVGHLEQMCFKPYDVNGVSGGDCPNLYLTKCCKRENRDDALNYNNSTVNAVIGAGASALCFQSNFFRTYSATIFPGISDQFPSIKSRLEENYRNFYPVCHPTDGDTNGNGVDINDFITWKNQFLGTDTRRTANFNCDEKVDLKDFEIWRENFNFGRL